MIKKNEVWCGKSNKRDEKEWKSKKRKKGGERGKERKETKSVVMVRKSKSHKKRSVCLKYKSLIRNNPLCYPISFISPTSISPQGLITTLKSPRWSREDGGCILLKEQEELILLSNTLAFLSWDYVKVVSFVYMCFIFGLYVSILVCA